MLKKDRSYFLLHILEFYDFFSCMHELKKYDWKLFEDICS